MRKILFTTSCLFIIFLLASCLSVPASAGSTGTVGVDSITGLSVPASAGSTGPRTLILAGLSISEEDTDDGFTAWYCNDYVYGGNVLVEVGYFDLNGERYGFVLYDGGYTGEIASFSREGLDYRWDWGLYSFVITPDGAGLYYDFSTSEDGTAKPRYVYRAYKR